MYRAITLIESFVTLTILVMSLYFISPIIFHLPDPILLKNEIDNLRAFIYQVQTKARYQKQSYTLTINQSSIKKQWCLIAVAQLNNKQTLCDCFNLKGCQLENGYFLYQPLSSKIQLKSHNLYPKTLLDISGKAGTLPDKCLGLSLNKSSQVIQFKPLGIIDVIPNNKRTRCKF